MELRFTVCDLCFELRGKATNPQLPLSTRTQALELYRRHVNEQHADRCIAWSLQAASGSSGSDVLCIALDGMDQGKYALPRHPSLRAVYAALGAQTSTILQNQPLC
jgi:hypothetical protein